MTHYQYTAINRKTSEHESGNILADNITEAQAKLREMGLSALSLKTAKADHKWQIAFNRVSLKEKIIFTRQLAVMAKAGLPIIKALAALEKQTENNYFKGIIEKIIIDVKGGVTLSKALEKFPKVFSELYVSVVKSGEQSGQLAEVLFNLSEQQEKDADLVSKIKSAMVYPIIILTALIGVVILIIYFVLPSLQSIFIDSGMKLPITTRILLGSANFVRNYTVVFIGIITTVFIAIRWWSKTSSGRLALDKIKISIPIFGSLTRKVYIARFARTFAMLTKASLPILSSIKIVRQTISNTLYQSAFERISAAVEGGKTVSSSMEKEKVFPPMVYQLIALGEESGNLEQSLMEIANFYDKEVDTLSKNLSTMLEPILLLVMGAGVAFVVAAVLGPIYSLVQAF